MEARSPRIDLFAFALGALALLTLGFFAARNGAAVIMCGLCLAGLIAARLAGFSNRALVPATLGLVAILWMAWFHPPGGSHETSALAHGFGGLLVGWALAEYLRHRIAWPLWALSAVAAVLCVTVMWEIGEYIGDRAFDTALIPSARDSALDIFFGTLGGVGGASLALLLLSPKRARR
jgi:hypothetical protein